MKGAAIMVFGKFISGAGDLYGPLKIREKVFAEELGLSGPESLPDEFCMHALAYEGGKPVGTGRILFDGDSFTIAGLAVLPEYRGRKYGDFVLRLLIDKAMMSNAQEIRLDALEGTEKFFEKVGFSCAGRTFGRAGRSWTPMVLYTEQIHKCCDCSL